MASEEARNHTLETVLKARQSLSERTVGRPNLTPRKTYCPRHQQPRNAP